MKQWDNSVLISIIAFLLGVVLSGGAGIARGDWLGDKAAEAVELRLKEQQKSDLANVMSDLLDIKEGVRDLRQELKDGLKERR